MKQAFIDMNHLSGRAAQEGVPNLDSFGVVAAAVEKRDDLIEYIGRRHQSGQGFNRLVPVSHSRWMVLIVGEFQRQQITGVDENRGHG